MTHRSDNKLLALQTLTGSTGSIDDLENEWLLSVVSAPVGVQVNDLWKQLFIEQGETGNNFNDLANAWLGTLGYTGALPDRWAAYWAAGGGGIGGGSWEYATLALAESSGDPWQDGDDVQITGGALFLYKSALAVDSYSGLIHKYPYDGTGVLGAVDTAETQKSTEKGSDPDTWTGWTNSSTAPYTLDTVGNQSRLLAGINGVVVLKDSELSVSDLESFSIVDGASLSGNQSTSVDIVYAYNAVISSQGDGVNGNNIVAAWRYSSSNIYWAIGHTNLGTYVVTSKTFSVQRRLWLYIKEGQWAVWFDADATPEVSGTVPRDNAYVSNRVTHVADDGPASSNIANRFIQSVSGAMETS